MTKCVVSLAVRPNINIMANWRSTHRNRRKNPNPPNAILPSSGHLSRKDVWVTQNFTDVPLQSPVQDLSHPPPCVHPAPVDSSLTESQLPESSLTEALCLLVWLHAFALWCSFYRFFARNTSLFTMSGFRQDLSQLIMLPSLLKILSEGELVACMHKYFRARLLSRGKLVLWALHHRRGSSSLSIVEDCM